jgi:hypothetical protein
VVRTVEINHRGAQPAQIEDLCHTSCYVLLRNQVTQASGKDLDLPGPPPALHRQLPTPTTLRKPRPEDLLSCHAIQV